MLDFTSVLYLGFRHAHPMPQPWAQLTTGRPAALEAAPEAERVAQDLAQLLRCERAVLAPSTLHLYWDLFDVLARDHIAIYADAATYPIARWGIERAAAKGIRAEMFQMHDPAALESLLQRDRQPGYRPVVVTDGVCAATGRTAPLPDYLKLVRERNGYLVIDDTQALGIFGKDPGQDAPYGRGGAGTPAFHGVEGLELILGSSLAKGFGAPLAVIASNAKLIANFEELSATRVHSSPPSLAVISAAQQALAINDEQGDRLRRQLAKLVRYFRECLRQIGLSAIGGLFPVQTLKAIPGVDPQRLHRRLLSFGVRAVLRSARHMPGAALSFLITVLHTRSDIGRCVDALQRSWALMRQECGKRDPALSRDGSGVLA
ncbi:MAG: aminotransferase class I/II-fold pyridoxal phosphate-dependent enzyme [Verrucomicrobiales bacterium]|nr:aminotransferase class I/II-fold pyridoxal phosphate-dependent enzyme [Verrucomicrobiales bacterium]